MNKSPPKTNENSLANCSLSTVEPRNPGIPVREYGSTGVKGGLITIFKGVTHVRENA
jgi:hypothetical protein